MSRKALLFILSLMLTPSLLLAQLGEAKMERGTGSQTASDAIAGRELVEVPTGAKSFLDESAIALEGQTGRPNTFYAMQRGKLVKTGALSNDLFDDTYANHFITMTFYENTNAGGASLTYWTLNTNTSVWLKGNFASAWNDRISSYVVKGGCFLKLYRDNNQAGGLLASIDRRGLRSVVVSTSAASDAASSWEVLCNDNVDAEGIAFTDSSYTGSQLPIWDSWNTTTTGFGDWDTKISSINVNRAAGVGVQFGAYRNRSSEPGTAEEPMTRQNSLDLFWTFQDLGLLPTDLNDNVAEFMGLPRGASPKGCNPINTCYQPNAVCEGFGFYSPSRTHCASGFGVSYCNASNLCVDAQTGYYVPNW
jgi:hypothetical protein